MSNIGHIFFLFVGAQRFDINFFSCSNETQQVFQPTGITGVVK